MFGDNHGGDIALLTGAGAGVGVAAKMAVLSDVMGKGMRLRQRASRKVGDGGGRGQDGLFCLHRWRGRGASSSVFTSGGGAWSSFPAAARIGPP
jgi:hypothetical protein